MSLLEARKISKDFGSSPLFASVDLSIEAGEKLALIGRNGCGKTSLKNWLRPSDASTGRTGPKRPEGLWDGLVLMRDALPYRKKIRE
ncbi:MAG TPA: ATP-binding cassette domain-containing protein [Spirochaetales bacterium]|nr:ATP-binding cassette domain-containing protein [Spirochaetales bacterium]